MDKVRFACPRCQTTMQTGAEKIGYDVACPHCAHRFRLIESDSPTRTQVATDSSKELDTTVDRPNLNVLASNSAVSPAGTATVLGPVVTPRPAVGFQCPYCQTTRTPVVKSEISQTGWLVFVVLLLTTCFGCVVGLFIRDNYRECSQCKIRLG